MKTKKKYCVVCEDIHDKKVLATQVVDELDLCDKHALTYKRDLEKLIK